VAVTSAPSPGCSPGGFRPSRTIARHGSGSAGGGTGTCAPPLGVEACKGFLKQVLEISDDAADTCYATAATQVVDASGDQFAQDGLPLKTLLGQILDVDFATAIDIEISKIEDDLRAKCATNIANGILLLCNSDKKPAAGAVATLTFVHFAAALPTDQHAVFGLYTRYDDSTPGRQPPDGFPLYIGSNAHALFDAPIETDGSFDPPVFADFRNNTGAYSTHFQFIGPDWFAFVTYDNPLYVRPYACQAAVDHPGCDTPVAPQTADGFKSMDAWLRIPPM
jgi:hypothetical protein